MEQLAALAIAVLFHPTPPSSSSQDVSICVREGAGPSPVKRGWGYPVWFALSQETRGQDLHREEDCYELLTSHLLSTTIYVCFMWAFGLFLI